MAAKPLEKFRLVGGTSLSLQRGHRLSVDIDLFTDAPYRSVNFKTIDAFLKKTYPYVDSPDVQIIGMGKSYFIGTNKTSCIKLDLYYTDPFMEPPLVADGIRFAGIPDLIAMKVDVVSRGGRKKDFWDLHELMPEYTLKQMLKLHKKRHPFTHDSKLIKTNFTRFDDADGDFDPICLREKYWELIKLDLIDFVK